MNCSNCSNRSNCNNCDEYCDACGQPPTESEPRLYECPQCGKHVCGHCCGGIGTICIDCEEAQDGQVPNDIFS